MFKVSGRYISKDVRKFDPTTEEIFPPERVAFLEVKGDFELSSDIFFEHPLALRFRPTSPKCKQVMHRAKGRVKKLGGFPLGDPIF